MLLANSRNFFSEGLLRLRMDHNFTDQRLYVDRWSIRAVHLVGQNVIARSPRYQRICSCCHCADLRLVVVEVALVHHVVKHVGKIDALSLIIEIANRADFDVSGQ